MWSARRSKRSSPGLVVHLVVDQTPLFQKSVHPHYGAHVSGQITSASRGWQVLARIESIRVDHKVAIAHVDLWRFWFVFAVEKLRQSTFFDLVQCCVVEPGSVWGHYDVMGLFAGFLLLDNWRCGCHRAVHWRLRSRVCAIVKWNTVICAVHQVMMTV